MANESLTEQLDQAVQAIITDRAATLPPTDTDIAPLIRIAARLRDLPRADFRARLKDDLERRASMNSEQGLAPAAEPEETTAPVNPVRSGFRTVTPYLTVANVHEEVAFIEKVFAGQGQIYGLGSAGGFHSEYQIGDSMLMIGGGGEGSAWRGTPAPASLHVYVEDVDAVYERALQAGATDLHPPQDQVYGERSAAFRDVGGNEWYPATYKGAQYIPEGVHNLMAYLHPRGAAKQLDFLKNAFGAEEIFRGESPDGVIYHAQVRIGNSVVEMGEAHGEWQPMPMHFMLYVDDVDAWHARALQTQGAVSLSEPADQPYGERVGAVKDPFDNTWYLSTHIAESATKNAKQTTGASPASQRSTTMTDSPKLFRIALEVADLEKAVAFYSKLLGLEGRMQRGSRAYFDCGPVILAILDPTPGGLEPKPNSIVLSSPSLPREQRRLVAEAETVAPRFYVIDPWGNGLCFVDETTLFTGK